MNKRQVISIWIVAIVLVAAVIATQWCQKPEPHQGTLRSPGQTLFEAFPGLAVARIEIQGAPGVVSLVKKDGKWTVVERDGYPANPTYVNEFLRSLSELKVTRGLEVGPSFAARFGMDSNSTQADERGLTATFKDAGGKELAKVSLGKAITSGGEAADEGGNTVGRYIRNHEDSSGFYAVSEMFPAVSAEVPRWLASDFISPEKIKSIAVSPKGKDGIEWKLVRESEEAEFKLDGAKSDEVVDTAVSGPLKSVFSYARFDDVLAADKVAASADAGNVRQVTIETFEGFIYQLAITPSKATVGATPSPDGSAPAAASTPCFVTVKVTADLPKERKKEANEKPDDAKSKDAAFAERHKSLSEKLSKEQALAGRTFEMSASSVESLVKDRSQIVTKANPPAPADPQAGSVQSLPGGLIAKPPGAPSSAPAQP